jgi:hypothetical protein
LLSRGVAVTLTTGMRVKLAQDVKIAPSAVVTGGSRDVRTGSVVFAGALYLGEGTEGVVLWSSEDPELEAAEDRSVDPEALRSLRDGYERLLAATGYPSFAEADRESHRPDGNDVEVEGSGREPDWQRQQQVEDREEVAPTVRVRFDNGLVFGEIDSGCFVEI